LPSNWYTRYNSLLPVMDLHYIKQHRWRQLQHFKAYQ
jgi:hypothetical protein